MISNFPDAICKICQTPLVRTLIHKRNGWFRFPEIEEDYKDMSEMIYGEYPNLEEIIKVLQELEKETNK